MMRVWFFILIVLGAFALGFWSVVPSASACDLADISEVAALADSSVDWSGGNSPDHDPDAPPREYDPVEGGLPSDASESSQEAPEETTVDEDPAEGGLPSDASESSQEAPEETTVDEDPAEGGLPSAASESTYEAPEETTVDDNPGEAGLPSRPVLLNFSDYAALQSEDPAEGGLPSDASESTHEAPEETTVDEGPAEGGLPSDASESTYETPEETATPTDIKTLDDVYTVLVVLLGSLWALAGLFFAFKLGGAFL